ncbi:MAG: Mn-containing catalase [Chlorobi bacterium]|nr:Mn-containing catalase [Chlorobiota bacterium]
MQYFVQAFSVRRTQPDKYDLLMDIATEEFSHLEIVGATITMLLNGVNGELKDAAGASGLDGLLNGQASKEEYIHQAMMNPHFLILSGGGPVVTDSAGIPWTGTYVNANGDLSVDLRSNIGAESRAKIVYEYLLQFTDDPYVKETLRFLMTREIAHFQMFTAALETVQPNFPPGVLQGDPRYTHTYFNMSDGPTVRGPWNEGQGPWKDGENWVYIDKPIEQVVETRGQIDQPIQGSSQTLEDAADIQRELARIKSSHIKRETPEGESQWSSYPQQTPMSPVQIDH